MICPVMSACSITSASLLFAPIEFYYDPSTTWLAFQLPIFPPPIRVQSVFQPWQNKTRNNFSIQVQSALHSWPRYASRHSTVGLCSDSESFHLNHRPTLRVPQPYRQVKSP